MRATRAVYCCKTIRELAIACTKPGGGGGGVLLGDHGPTPYSQRGFARVCVDNFALIRASASDVRRKAQLVRTYVYRSGLSTHYGIECAVEGTILSLTFGWMGVSTAASGTDGGSSCASLSSCVGVPFGRMILASAYATACARRCCAGIRCVHSLPYTVGA